MSVEVVLCCRQQVAQLLSAQQLESGPAVGGVELLSPPPSVAVELLLLAEVVVERRGVMLVAVVVGAQPK